MEFGELLRQLREKAGWKQEYLGKLVHVSGRTIRSWEKEGKRPKPPQARALAEAFGLTGIEYAQFIALSEGRDPGEAQAAIPAAVKTLPRDIDSFTGRETELGELATAAACAPDSGGIPRICVIHGMPGIGKSKLAIHFAHQVASNYPAGQFFVDLYGHSAQRRPVEPKDELSALLLAAGVPRQEIPDELDERAKAWRHWTAEHKILLLLDDARNAAQVIPLLPGSTGNLVLITTRQWLPTLPDVTDVSLEPMSDEDAARLFSKVASRPGLEPGSPAVTDVLDLFYGLPIIITSMAAQLKQHRTRWPSDLRTRLGRNGGRLEVRVSDRDTVRNALDLSYHNLTDELQRLFRYLALHPGPDIDLYAAAALVNRDLEIVRDNLDDLFGYHLINELTPERYKFHDLIRDYAQELVAADPAADRASAERRLLSYYLSMVRTADSFLARQIPTGVPDDTGPLPLHTPQLLSRDDAFAWMDGSYNHLHAAATYACTHGYPEYSELIPAFMDEYLVRRGHWDQARDLYELALNAAGDGNPSSRARALYYLGGVQYLMGDLVNATPNLREALSLYVELEDVLGRAHTLKKLGAVSLGTGDYTEAARVWSEALGLYGQAGDQRAEAKLLSHLGVLQYETGEIAAAFSSQSAARDICTKLDDPVGRADALCYLGEIQRERGHVDEALLNIKQAMDLYRALDDQWNVAGAQYFLGGALRVGRRFAEARQELDAALAGYRKAGDNYDEAGVLNQIGLLQTAAGEHTEAATSLARALELYVDYGSVNGELEVCNSLGELSLATDRLADAESYHRKALDIAVDKGIPREEARAREGIGHALRLTGRQAGAAEFYRVACDLYEKLESPSAGRLKEQGFA
jgi:tetratricopeptide (TPR) repeat protein/transcriptional regulator with XRE-family HTH domain